jgi:hypothetical protein
MTLKVQAKKMVFSAAIEIMKDVYDDIDIVNFGIELVTEEND